MIWRDLISPKHGFRLLITRASLIPMVASAFWFKPAENPEEMLGRLGTRSWFENSLETCTFTAAGWTPHGLLLSIGDTAEHNAVEWLRCDDWDRYNEPDQWTVERVQGEVRSELGSAPAFQFWGVAPGANPDALLLGGDVNEARCMRRPCTMRHHRLFDGWPGRIPEGSNLTHVVGVIRRPAPEVSTNVVFCGASTPPTGRELLAASSLQRMRFISRIWVNSQMAGRQNPT